MSLISASHILQHCAVLYKFPYNPMIRVKQLF